MKAIAPYGENQTLFKCRETGYLIALPEPDPQMYDDYYTSNYFSGERYDIDGAKASDFTSSIWNAWKSRLNTLTGNMPKDPMETLVLDIGAGTGKFLELCSHRGLKTAAVEFSDAARKTLVARNNPVECTKSINEMHSLGLKADVVTMWAVIEHMYYSDNLLNKITSLVNRNGLLAFSFPNPYTLNRYIFGSHWRYFIPVEHVNFFHPSHFKSVLKDKGFELVDERSTFSRQAFYDGLNNGCAKHFPMLTKKALAKLMKYFNSVFFFGDTYEVVLRREF